MRRILVLFPLVVSLAGLPGVAAALCRMPLMSGGACCHRAGSAMRHRMAPAPHVAKNEAARRATRTESTVGSACRCQVQPDRHLPASSRFYTGGSLARPDTHAAAIAAPYLLALASAWWHPPAGIPRPPHGGRPYLTSHRFRC